MVPLVTDTEKTARRQKVKEKRRRVAERPGRWRRRRRAPTSTTRSSRSSPTTMKRKRIAWRSAHVAMVNEAGRLMRREAGAFVWIWPTRRWAMSTGSPWIRNQVERQSLPLDALGLDFYHLADNVHKARRDIYGEDNEDGQHWAGSRCTPSSTRLRGDLAAVVGMACRPASWPAAAADRLLNYVSERREMIRYPEFQGLADRQRSDGSDLQDADGAAQGLRHALGCRQR